MKLQYKQILVQGDSVLPAETPLYRYLSTEMFLHLVAFQELSFSRIVDWDDAHEGMRLGVKKTQMPEHPYAKKELSSFFASCWSLQTEDRAIFKTDEDYQNSVEELREVGSDAMWRAYCPNGGVRIRTTLGKLETLFCSVGLPTLELYSGKVDYDPHGSNWSRTIKNINFLSAFLQKRVCFRSEAEFRFIFCALDDVPSNRVRVPVNELYGLIDEVLISPAKPSTKWRSHALVGEVQNIYPRDNYNAQGGIKNGKPFCRISQLYGNVEWPS